MTALLKLLHLCDSMFPTGSFAYSEGLESASAGAFVGGVADLHDWLEVCREEGFWRSDGPSIVLAWPAIEAGDWQWLLTIDEEGHALRPSSATRAANRSMGHRLLTTWQGLYADVRLADLVALVGPGHLGPTLPVAFAAVSCCGGIALRDALTGYAYTRLAATSSAAMRLIAIGQTDAHRLLQRALDRVPAIVDALLIGGARPESFAPALDIAQMTQPYVRTRLFRS